MDSWDMKRAANLEEVGKQADFFTPNLGVNSSLPLSWQTLRKWDSMLGVVTGRDSAKSALQTQVPKQSQKVRARSIRPSNLEKEIQAWYHSDRSLSTFPESSHTTYSSEQESWGPG